MWTAARLFWRSIDAVMALLLAAMTALVFANVVLRYGLSSGFRQSAELARMWFVRVVMLNAAVALRRGEHLALSDVSEALFPRAVPAGLCRLAGPVHRICAYHHRPCPNSGWATSTGRSLK